MKKTVLTFGLISGAVSSALMLLSVPLLNRIGFDRGAVLGYSGIVLSFLFVFFGVRSYRENVGHGAIGFGRALAVGLLITLISCVCYVATWEIIYFKLWPGFADQYSAFAMDKARASGASPQKLEETALSDEPMELALFKDMYDKPLLNAAITLVEPLPIGLVVTFVSAGVLRRRPAPAAAVPSAAR